MMYKEIILKSLLVVACLYLAGLNLWLLFKDWLQENFEKRQKHEKKQQTSNKRIGRVGASQIAPIPDFVGKSKFNLQEEQKRRHEQQVEPAEKPKPLLSIDLEEEPDNDQPVSSEEEIIILAKYDKSEAELSGNQSFTMDEFEMVAKTLKGSSITKDEQKQVVEIIPRIKGTDMYEQFIGQVKGAEDIAMEILRMSEVNTNSENNSSSAGFDFDKFIRV